MSAPGRNLAARSNHCEWPPLLTARAGTCVGHNVDNEASNAVANTVHLWLSDEEGVVFLPGQTLDNANCLSDLARADRYFRSSLGNR